MSAYFGATFHNDGTNDLTDVFAYIGNAPAGTPGVYYTNKTAALTGPLTGGMFALQHEGGSSGLADATRYIGTIPAGGQITVYWLISYPVKDIYGHAMWGPSVKPDDDLTLAYDFWGTAKDAGSAITATVNRTVTLRNEISAMANKILPNTANRVPQEFLDLLQQYAPTWTNSTVAGNPGTKIVLEGFWYNLGNVGQGFDNDGDLVPDQNAWMQPIGDPSLFDPSCFRLIATHTMLVANLKDGTQEVYMDDDKLYYQNIPDNNNVVGLVVYEWMSLKDNSLGWMTPYQEAASGYDNEKFNGDYGVSGDPIVSGDPTVAMQKDVDQALANPGDPLRYTVSFTNTGAVDLGEPELGLPVVVQDSIPTGTTYVAGSATNGNVLPAGVSQYTTLYSTNHGSSWMTSEPVVATNVTDIQWWLSDVLASHAAGIVRFSVQIKNPCTNVPPLIHNIAGLSIGNTYPFLWDDALTLLKGTNVLGDTVFADIGSGTNFANGVQNAGEPGISNVTVKLYYDIDGNGVADSWDFQLASTTTATNGYYLFHWLADGKYVAVVDATDADIPFGYTATTSTWYNADLDPARTNGAAVSFLTADFAFAPALSLTKSVVGNSTMREGSNVTFQLTLTNRISGDSGDAQYTMWATNTLPSAKYWSNPSNALGAPDGVYAVAPLSKNLVENMALNGYRTNAGAGAITKVELIVPMYVGAINAGDLITFSVLAGGTTVFSSNRTVETLSTGTLVLDVTSSKAWTWTDFGSTNTSTDFASAKNGSGGSDFRVDAVGFRVTSDWRTGMNNPDLTLNPVPLTDEYNISNLLFVSSTRTPQSVTTNGSTGRIYWPNVGPIYPGGTSTVFVTFKTLEIGGLASSNTTTNTSFVTNATYASGIPANTATSSAPVTVLRSGSIGDYIWWDLNGNGTQEVYEAGISGVSVVLTPTNGVNLGNGANRPITNVTDRYGFYLFDSLPTNGPYTVTVLTNTISGTLTNTWNEDPTNDSRTVVTLTNLENHVTADFGYRYFSFSNIIEGTVWNDQNRNGATTPDSGEPWLTNVTVYLFTNLTATGTPIATQRTDRAGYYRFAGNYSGNYSVLVVTNTGMMTNSSWVESFDSDGLGTANFAAITNVAPAQVRRADYSYYRSGPYSIGDTVFYDWDGNGTQAPTEEGIPGIPMLLYLDRNTNGLAEATELIGRTVTAISGYYSFTNLPAATNYIVAVDSASTGFPSGLTCTADPFGANDGMSVVTLTTNRTDQDFGYMPHGSSSIGDTVWRDMNGDGIQFGPLETGISNITVTLWVDFNGDGIYVSNRSSNVSGNYLFDNLPAGNYRVTVDTNDTSLPVDSIGNFYKPTTPTSYTMTLATGQAYLTADFGFAPRASIGDTVFWDSNQNGTQDYNEDGVSNVTVRLYSHNGTNRTWDATNDTLVAWTLTDTNGVYVFSGLSTGKYIVVVVRGSQIGTNACSADPDADGVAFGPNCDGQYVVSVGYGTSFMGADFGYVPPAAIGDTVWFDLNSNGRRDSTEYGIPYVMVGLYANGSLVASNQTDTEGEYIFTGMTNGTYEVRVLTNNPGFPAGLGQVFDPDGVMDGRAPSIVISDGGIPGSPRHIISVAGTTWTNGDMAIDFGYRYAGTNSLSGTVGLEDLPYNGMMGTGPSGVGSNEMAYPSVDVFVYRWNDTNGNGVIESAERVLVARTATSTNGDYSFTGLPNGSNYIVSLSAPEEGLTLTTTATSGVPSWRVVNTTNTENYTESAYQIVTVASVITNVDFAFMTQIRYDFGDLPDSYGTLRTSAPEGASHRVRQIPNLYLGASVDTEVNGRPSADALGDDTYPSAGTDDEDGVFSIGMWKSGTNGGCVRTVVGNGSGWLVGFVDFNNDGTMTYPGEMVVSAPVSAGVYTNYFTIPSGTFNPSNTTGLYARFRLFDSEPPYPKFAYQGTTDNGEVEDYFWRFGALGDYVWKDVNGDGVQDASEAPLTNIMVYVDINADGQYGAGEPSTRTDTSGRYWMGGFSTGTYSIVVNTNDASFLAYNLAATSYDLDGTNTANRAAVSLTNGQVRSDVDFGYMSMVLGGVAWFDANTNGAQDEVMSAAGVSNILVRLYDAQTNWIGSTYTGTNGSYLFEIPLPGQYFVEFYPFGYLISPRNATDDASDSDVSLTAPYRIEPVTVPAGGRLLDEDMGLYAAAYNNSIGDKVWFDYNRNGIQETNESGVANIPVTLYDLQTNVVRTTVTDVEGLYYFAELPVGSYFIGFTKPSDYFYSPRYMTDGARDSDASLTTGYTASFAVGTGTVNRTWDCGIYAMLDLGVTKVPSVADPDEGQTIWFTVVVTNHGPSGATRVRYTDLWPTNMTFVGAGATVGSFDVSSNTWNLGSLAIGGSASLTMTGTVHAGTTGNIITNVISLTNVFEPDTNSANNSATATVAVAGMDIAVYKVVDNPYPFESSNIVFSIAATNLGPRNATAVVLTDVLPAGLTYISNLVSQGSYNSTNGTWAIGALSVSNGVSMKIWASVNVGTAGSTLTNTATRTGSVPSDKNPANDSASAIVIIMGADLGVVKTVDNEVPQTNTTVEYTIRVTNYGPTNTTGVQLRDPLTNGITYVSSSNSQGSYTSSNGLWNIGALNVGNYATLWITARVETNSLGRSVTNRSVITASDMPDRNPSNNEDTAVIMISDLKIFKSSDVVISVDPGSNITYTIIVTNSSPLAHSDLVVNDPLPLGVHYVANSSGKIYPTGTNNSVADQFNVQSYTNNSGTMNWRNSWQETGDDASALTGNAMVMQDGASAYVLSLSGTGPAVSRIADLSTYRSASLSFDFRRQGLGDATDYVAVNVSSNGGTAWTEVARIAGPTSDSSYQATNVNISAFVSTNTAVQFTASGLRANQNQYIFVDNVNIALYKRITLTNSAGIPPNLASGLDLDPAEGVVLTYKATVDLPPTYLMITNTASTTSSRVPTPISATVRDPVSRVDLGVTKTVNREKVGTNEVIWFTITLTNLGPHKATSVELTDYWPTNAYAGVIYSNSLPSQGTFNSNNMVWYVGTLNAGNGATLVITGKVNSVSDDRYITNKVVITHLVQYDGNPANDWDQAVVETLVVLGRFEAFASPAGVVVEWDTVSEIDTAGFYLERARGDSLAGGAIGPWERVRNEVLPAAQGAPQGATYRLLDFGATSGVSYLYALIETEGSGKQNRYGPFLVTPTNRVVREFRFLADMVDGFVATPRFSALKEFRLKERLKEKTQNEVRRRTLAAAVMPKHGGALVDLKLTVREDGVYYVSVDEMAALMDAPTDSVVFALRRRQVGLANNGEAVAMAFADDYSGFYFYGQKANSMYSFDNVYVLSWDPGVQMSSVIADPPTGESIASFAEKVHVEQNAYALTAIVTDPSQDPWFWDYLMSSYAPYKTKTYRVDTPSLATAQADCRLEVRLQGVTKVGPGRDHRATIKLNGTVLGEGRWAGKTATNLLFSFKQSILREGSNTVEITAEKEPLVSSSIFYLDWIDVTYQRKAQAANGQIIATEASAPSILISGFTSDDITVLKLADPKRPVIQLGSIISGDGGLYSIQLAVDQGVDYAAFSAGSARAPVLGTMSGASLRDNTNAVQYLVITVPDLAEAAAELAEYRAGKGLLTKVVKLEEIYDAFNNGISDPAAIRTFLRYTYENWTVAPRYVVLAGEGTFDYKGYLGGLDNLVPPMMAGMSRGLFASDSLYVDFNSDQIPEMAIGRIPVVTSAELRSFTAKIRNYEAVPEGTWQKAMTLAADIPDKGGDFTASSEAVSSLIPADWQTDKIYLSQQSLTTGRTALKARLNEGRSFLNFFGHGGIDSLGMTGILNAGDVPLLVNSNKLTLITAMSCVIGRYEIPNYDSLGEVLLLSTTGGACAVWSPSGLSLNMAAQKLSTEFYTAVFAQDKGVLGEAILEAKTKYAAGSRLGYVADIYNLLGDPAMTMTGFKTEYGVGGGTLLPLVAPSDATASLSDDGVVISWTDRCEIEQGYIIERRIGNSSWVEIARVGANVTTYTDAGVDSDLRPVYRVKAFNAVAVSPPSQHARLMGFVTALPWLLLLLE